jgi:site-specific recombinase XerD
MSIPYVHIWNILHLDFSGLTPNCVFAGPLDTSPEGLNRNAENLQKLSAILAPRAEIVEQSLALWQAPDCKKLKGKRDRALLALLLACGLRRHEAVDLRIEHLEQREEHWAIVDLKGKAGHVRTIPIPGWVMEELQVWLNAAGIDRGKIFRRVTKMGRILGEGMTEKAVWHIVKDSAKRIGLEKLAPHDLRRTCARLCHASGGELEQIQFLLGHVSIQTTERYLGCKQRIRSAVNDQIGIEPSR